MYEIIANLIISYVKFIEAKYIKCYHKARVIS